MEISSSRNKTKERFATPPASRSPPSDDELSISPLSCTYPALIESRQQQPSQSSSKHLSTRDLQARILLEQDRITSKRDRLQRNREVVQNGIDPENPYYPDPRVVKSATPSEAAAAPRSQEELDTDSYCGVFDSLNHQILTFAGSKEKDNNGVIAPVNNNLKENDDGWIDARGGGMTSIEMSITPVKRRTTCANRKILWSILLLLLVIAVVTALAITLTNRNGSSSSSNAAISSSCQEATNILQDCQCNEELPTPLSEEVDFNRNLVLDFLIAQGALNETFSNTTSPTSCDAQNQALVWVSGLKNHVEQPPTNLQLLQRYSLAVVYQELKGNGWKRNKSWLESKTSECDWEGIVCSQTFRIFEIDLHNNALEGILPGVELGLLKTLRELHMDGNPDLKGPLSYELMRLPLLQTLVLSETSISGTLPAVFDDRLVELRLSSTKLEGTIPTAIGLLVRLRNLDLSNNAFEGTLPVEIMSLGQMEFLDLSSNQLQGTLPSFSSPFLETLNLHDNTNLTGPFPNPYSTQLSFINFADTALTGAVPQAYCELLYLDSLIVDCDVNRKACPCCRCIEE